MEIQAIDGRLDAAGKSFAIVAARFNHRLVDLLIDGARDCLVRHGAAARDIRLVRVPGAWEVPLALDVLADIGEVDAMVALAVVIRGETSHFDYICGECSHGVARVSAEHNIPIGFGVLTCETSAQAAERAGGKAGNKGWEAAEAALEMTNLIARLRSQQDVAPTAPERKAG